MEIYFKREVWGVLIYVHKHYDSAQKENRLLF